MGCVFATDGEGAPVVLTPVSFVALRVHLVGSDLAWPVRAVRAVGQRVPPQFRISPGRSLRPSPPVETPVLPQGNVIGAAPLLGSSVDRNRVPARNQVFTSQDVSLTGPPDALQTLQNQAQGVNLDNAAGNPTPNTFAPSVTVGPNGSVRPVDERSTASSRSVAVFVTRPSSSRRPSNCAPPLRRLPTPSDTSQSDLHRDQTYAGRKRRCSSDADPRSRAPPPSRPSR
jgi:hypothetical protein